MPGAATLLSSVTGDVPPVPGLALPGFDREALVPRIAHLGLGGFARAHLARYTDGAAAHGGDWGIVGLGLLPGNAALHEVLERQRGLYTLVERGSGEPSMRIVGSLVASVHAPPGHDAALAAVIADPRTAIVSLTITEAGYGEPSAAALATGTPTTFDRLARALATRQEAGAGPLTILSLDNLPGNGEAARRAMLLAAGRLDPALEDWVAASCSFPSSMVDRITPVTSDADRAWVREHLGLDDAWPVVCEEFRQWVVADDFPAGRPAWEQDGVLFTPRVHDWERYKLRLLNAGHSSIAYLAALAGIVHVDEVVGRPELRGYLEELLCGEALPSLEEIPGHPREAYIDSVLQRFSNTGVHDRISRVCVDGTAKFTAFLIPTVVHQLASGGPIRAAATALAAWARYLGVVPPALQAADASGEVARAAAGRALAEPRAFLDFAEVFPPELRGSERFAVAFEAAYRRIAEDGPLAAAAAAARRAPR